MTSTNTADGTGGRGAATGAPGPALRCLVVDDQPVTRDRLVRMLHDDPAVRDVSTATDCVAALRLLRHTDVDAVFVEARMPGMDGMELAWVLRRFRAAPAVVFVSRYPGHAADAFDLGAVDFLTKPPLPERLAECLRRVSAVRRTRPALVTRVAPAPVPGTPTTPPWAGTDDDVIPVDLGATTKLVRRSSVRWVQAHGDYVRLHTADGSYLIRARLAALADGWLNVGLVRIHRSYLVQLRYVAEVRSADNGQLSVVVDGRQLPVSRRLAPAVRRPLLDAARYARSRVPVAPPPRAR